MAWPLPPRRRHRQPREPRPGHRDRAGGPVHRYNRTHVSLYRMTGARRRPGHRRAVAEQSMDRGADVTEEFLAAGGRITTTYPFDLARLLQRSIHEHSAETAVVCDGQARSYAGLGDRAYRLRHALPALGVHAGDRVAVLLSNRLEYPEVDVGLAFSCAVRVSLNVRLGLEDLSYILDDSGARVLISEQRFDDVAAELASRHGVHWVRMGAGTSPDAAVGYEELLSGSSGRRELDGTTDAAPAWISYTSGTTGRPKGVVLSSRALVNVAFNLMLEMGPISTERSVLLPQPLSHGAGYFVIPYLASRWDCARDAQVRPSGGAAPRAQARHLHAEVRTSDAHRHPGDRPAGAVRLDHLRSGTDADAADRASTGPLRPDPDAAVRPVRGAGDHHLAAET
ncbi:MAG: AMP-binding protein [Propionibacteriales bacterium]|nr:AMP-binding protein [Propionibacteriales bacterium]